MPAELYGPTMISFTLVALLLFQMKSSGHIVVRFLLSFCSKFSCVQNLPCVLQQEGTLMGSALITCLGYWTGISALFTVVAYVCNSHVRSIQILTMLVSFQWRNTIRVALLNEINAVFHACRVMGLRGIAWLYFWTRSFTRRIATSFSTLLGPSSVVWARYAWWVGLSILAVGDLNCPAALLFNKRCKKLMLHLKPCPHRSPWWCPEHQVAQNASCSPGSSRLFISCSCSTCISLITRSSEVSQFPCLFPMPSYHGLLFFRSRGGPQWPTTPKSRPSLWSSSRTPRWEIDSADWKCSSLPPPSQSID